MGFMKNAIMDVQDMYAEGYSPAEIAEMTQFSFEEVLEILDIMAMEDAE